MRVGMRHRAQLGDDEGQRCDQRDAKIDSMPVFNHVGLTVSVPILALSPAKSELLHTTTQRSRERQNTVMKRLITGV